MQIRYCDRCKFDTFKQSKAIPEDESESTIKICPMCGEKLFEVESYDDIP